MTEKYDIRRFVDLHERIQRFCEIAGELVTALNLEKSGGRGPRGEPASERGVRDYVRRRVLSPTLRGASSDERGYYGFRHLVEFLAARVLINDGWPLEKIAERHRQSTTEELIALIPGQAVMNDAVALARSFRSSAPTQFGAPPVLAESAVPTAAWSMNEPEPPDDLFHEPKFERTVISARSRAELPLLMRQLTASEQPPRVNQRTAIELGPEITLLIDQDLVRHMTPVEADLIGRTVTATLLDYPNLAKQRKTENDH